MRFFTFTCLLALLSTPAYSGEEYIFEKFLVGKKPNVGIVKIDLDSADEKAIKLLEQKDIVEIDELEANFSQEYSVISGGCGSMCQINIAINLNTGKVLGPVQSNLGVCFKGSSSLFIVNPDLSIFGKNIPDWVYTYYYKVSDINGFELLKKSKSDFSGMCDFGQ